MTADAGAAVRESEVRLPAAGGAVIGDLIEPPEPIGVVLFAHGSGSSRFSRRNRFVAAALNHAGCATLLMDLLTPQEDAAYANRFDIDRLADRLAAAAEELARRMPTMPLGVFGASTGAAAALQLAAVRPQQVAAVVSRGGRPDLAGEAALAAVRAPTLLIVGGNDFGVIELNEAACAQLRCEKELAIVPGATHLFEEPGTLEEVARLATAWFARHLRTAGPRPAEASRAS
jgi:putative phosphoribosyl transferase